MIGDFSWYDAPLCDDPEYLFKVLPDQPRLHETIGPYYEVLVARLIDLVPRYEGWRELSFRIGTAPNDCLMETPISTAVFRDYAIAWGDCDFLREDAYERVKPFLDRNFFDVARVTLD